jgi:hypothetical protein
MKGRLPAAAHPPASARLRPPPRAENLLVRGPAAVLADFGLARPFRAGAAGFPPGEGGAAEGPFTEYVSTRWYREC